MRGDGSAGDVQVAIAFAVRECFREDEIDAVVVKDAGGIRRDDRRHHGEGDGRGEKWRERAEACTERDAETLRGTFGLDGDRSNRSAHAASTPKRDSFRYSVDGSMPRTSAARDLLPPSLCSTQRM